MELVLYVSTNKRRIMLHILFGNGKHGIFVDRYYIILLSSFSYRGLLRLSVGLSSLRSFNLMIFLNFMLVRNDRFGLLGKTYRLMLFLGFNLCSLIFLLTTAQNALTTQHRLTT